MSADYMIAADGAESETRNALGITRNGVGHLRTLRSVLFRCRDADVCLERGYQQFEIVRPGFSGFLTAYGDGRWVLMFDDDRDRREDELRAAIEGALVREMPVEIIATGRWELAGQIADRYASGRVFLAGDAAHQLPPTRGGFGANTGIADVWNLYVLLAAAAAWRTAADGLPLDVVVIGDSVVPIEPRFLNDRFGIGDVGATLVRPDGVVAWRTTDPASKAALREAFEQVAFTMNAGGEK